MFQRAPEVYFGIPAWVYLGLLATVTGAAFCLKAWPYFDALTRAHREDRLDHWGRRLRMFLADVLGQQRRVDEPITGVAITYVIWACVIHVFAFAWDLLRATILEMSAPVLPDIRIPYAAEVQVVRWMLIAFAVLGLAGVIVAGAGQNLVAGGRSRRRGRTTLLLAAVGTVFAASLVGATAGLQNGNVALAAWWVEMVAVLVFLASLPFSGFVHVLASPVGVFTRSLKPGKLPPPSPGARVPSDFTWRELLSGLACAECGRCELVCPACAANEARSPRKLMQAIAAAIQGRESIPRLVPAEQLWACDTCAACMEVCPSFNEHVPVIVEMRRRLFADAETEPGLRKAIGNLLLHGNSLGVPAERRADWTDDLGFAIPDARKTPVEYLWFVGDYASSHPRVIAATRAAARVLHRAHVDFGILYEGERNAGNDVRRAGAECMFELMERNNLQTLAGAHFGKIVSTDPHSYNVLKNEYSWNGYRPAVLHFAELLERLLTAGKLPMQHESGRPVTYQDPCYLGRYNGVYDAPRHVLQELGFPVLELPGHRASAWCCGSGGGRIWMSDFVVDESSPSVRRIREAAGMPEVSRVVVACPKDLAVFCEAVNTAGLEQRLEVRDLAEVADEVSSASSARP